MSSKTPPHVSAVKTNGCLKSDAVNYFLIARVSLTTNAPLYNIVRTESIELNLRSFEFSQYILFFTLKRIVVVNVFHCFGMLHIVVLDVYKRGDGVNILT